VECCIGGDPVLPDMSLSVRRPLDIGDVLFVCTDGMWGALKDEEIASTLYETDELRVALAALGKRAVTRGGLASDNTSAAALRVTR